MNISHGMLNSNRITEDTRIEVHDGTTDISLCNQCQMFDIQSFTRAPDGWRGYLLDNVQLRASQGCEFCAFLNDCVEELPNGDWQKQKRLYVHLSLWENYTRKIQGSQPNGLRANRLKLWIGGLSTVKPRLSDIGISSAEICLAADINTQSADDITGRYLGSNLASNEHVDVIKNWLLECTSETHKRCNQDIASSRKFDHRNVLLPTRCIRVPKEDSSTDSIKLHETTSKRGQYITLSHRWSHATEMSQTTVSNYDLRKACHGLNQLPRLFLDVFDVARKLEIEYVWIDSLCIIQDDSEDWKQEAPKMSQYYQYSTLTIAATKVLSADRGLYSVDQGANEPWDRLVRLPYRSQVGSVSGWIYVYRRKTSLHDEYLNEIRSSDVLRRGWIVQEWILSKRILWFTPTGLWYECQESPARTAFQEQLDPEYKIVMDNIPLGLKYTFGFNRDDTFEDWYKVVELYAPTNLTNVKQDRMLAILSIADAVSGKLRQKASAWPDKMLASAYCAGLWLQDIHHGLLWRMTGESEADKQLEHAASWSWIPFINSIRWPNKAKSSNKQFEVTGFCMINRGVHESPEFPLIGQCPNLRLASNQSTSSAPSPGTDLESTWVCIHMKCMIFNVHVRGYLSNDQLKDVADLTESRLTDGSSRWRAICSESDNVRVAGWGSLEQLKQTGCADLGFVTSCLLVATRKVKVLGHWGIVADVIFVQRCQTENGSKAYRRLGVGVLYDQKLVQHVLCGDSENIQLI